jgi:hypothetical protein
MKILVSGYKPAHSKKINYFVSKLDLGVEGAFTRFSEVVEVTFKKDATENQIKDATVNIKIAYELFGCVQVETDVLDK